MTGVVTFEQLQWIIGLIMAAGCGVAGFLFWVYRIVVGLRREFEAELAERDTAAQLEKERAKLIEGELRRELSEYKVVVSEKYATKHGVTDAVGRMEQAIERLTSMVHDSVRDITGRMDRILEARDGPAPRSRPRSGG